MAKVFHCIFYGACIWMLATRTEYTHPMFDVKSVLSICGVYQVVTEGGEVIVIYRLPDLAKTVKHPSLLDTYCQMIPDLMTRLGRHAGPAPVLLRGIGGGVWTNVPKMVEPNISSTIACKGAA